MGKIVIEGIEIYAYHGFFEEEQIIGGNYIVDVEIDTDFMLAEQKDELTGTVNYADICLLVQEEMRIKSKLIEHVASRIVERILRDFAAVGHVKIKLAKINPPVKIQLKSVSVIIEKSRENYER